MTDAAAAEEIVRRFLAALDAADADAALALLDEEVVHDRPDGSRAIGREDFRWWLGMAGRARHERIGDVAVMVGEGGRRAAAEVTLRGEAASGGASAAGNTGRYSVPAGYFFELEDGRIARLSTYVRAGSERPPG